MEEMRQLIGLRQGEPAVTPRGRPRSVAAPSDAASAYRGSGGGESNSALFEGFARTVEGLTDEAEDGLSRSMSCHESLQDELRQLASDFKEVRGCLLVRERDHRLVVDVFFFLIGRLLEDGRPGTDTDRAAERQEAMRAGQISPG